jgi:hypothetical protein
MLFKIGFVNLIHFYLKDLVHLNSFTMSVMHQIRFQSSKQIQIQFLEVLQEVYGIKLVGLVILTHLYFH